MPTFLLEVGTEELPADFIDSAIKQWKTTVSRRLEEQFLTPETLEIFATPRRLALLIQGIPKQQPDREEDIKGPPASAAFKDGKPTKAAQGFARKQGIEVETIEIRDTPKGAFTFVRRQIPGRPATEILQELAPQWILGLEGRRFMRWGDGELRFPRPIRWLIALLDEAVIPLELISGSNIIQSDRYSRGHRILHPDPITLAQASDYANALKVAGVEVNPKKRQDVIQKQIKAIAKKLGGNAEISDKLLAEVTNLVEFPTAIAGKFEESFLSLPTEVITTVMVTHQRYFPRSQSRRNGIIALLYRHLQRRSRQTRDH